MIKQFLEDKIAQLRLEGLQPSHYFKSVYCYVRVYFIETSRKSLPHL